MSEFYGAHDDADSIRAINHALDHGVNLIYTTDIYGQYTAGHGRHGGHRRRVSGGRSSGYALSGTGDVLAGALNLLNLSRVWGRRRVHG
ncbi:hypothetical protein RA280_17855 [Cupriavidus sp. CV2]|uniref:hypothetical protein n=1 Tax=Cupriavidus ulmosensis TaxID=3065913 RepID=UPI00296AB66E|nr:hypothetical protein [Cupriavidus sp. CV2]MDW3683581.1 hypothetical protein [Cupriavidus sp. CV2]